jgi:hypothetical protein
MWKPLAMIVAATYFVVSVASESSSAAKGALRERGAAAVPINDRYSDFVDDVPVPHPSRLGDL